MTALRVLIITPRLVERFWEKVDKNGPTQLHMPTPCWPWMAAAQRAYGIIQVKLEDGRFVSELAHRVSWALTHGGLPEGFVCHRCDFGLCIRPSHLFLGTAALNSADMVAKGRQATGDQNGSRLHPEARPRGEAHYETDLTEDDVRAIRQARAAGVPLTELAARYGGLTRQAIWRIVHRRSWKHVK